MSWTCPGHYKVHVHGRDSPGRPVHGHCPIPLPVLRTPNWSNVNYGTGSITNFTCGTAPLCISNVRIISTKSIGVPWGGLDHGWFR